MANQAEVPKAVQYVVLGPDNDEAAATKVVMYLILEPSDVADTTNKQGHVYSQIIRRD